MKVIVCLPTYNEIESVETMIKAIRALGFPVFLSDGGSNDGTVEKAKALGCEVVFREGKGKGYGVQAALKYAAQQEYDGLVLIDCDQTYPVSKIPELVEKFNDHDLVIGTRPMGSITFLRRIVNVFLRAMINLLFGGAFPDIASGLRILRVEKFDGRLDARRFDVEPQICAVAQKDNLRIGFVPISYHPRKGKSKIAYYDTFYVIWKILKERLRK